MIAPDRLPRDLLGLPRGEALLKISHWFEDCQQHCDLGRPGGLPTPPFSFEDAWIITRLASGAGAGGKPPKARGQGIAMLITQEWFERHVALEGDHDVGAGWELMNTMAGDAATTAPEGDR